MPTMTGNIRGTTQRQPDVPRVESCGDGIGRRAIAELGQHEVTHENTAVGATKLIGDGLPELTQAHGNSNVCGEAAAGIRLSKEKVQSHRT